MKSDPNELEEKGKVCSKTVNGSLKRHNQKLKTLISKFCILNNKGLVIFNANERFN